MRLRKLIVAATLLAIGVAASAEAAVYRNQIFENVVATLQKRFHDAEFRRERIPEIAERYRLRAHRATGVDAQRQITHEFLSNIPATHMGLLSQRSLDCMFRELRGEPGPTFGFQLVEIDGKHYAHEVLEGGPAEKAGLLRGDRIVAINGESPDESERVDWRTDDAYHPDPPVRLVFGRLDDVIQLRVERQPGKELRIDVPCEKYSALQAARNSARIIEQDGKRIAYLHFWMIHLMGVDTLLKEMLEGDFADCDAFIFDLRGRGGNGMIIQRVVDICAGKQSTWDKPVVGIINGMTRSAKEVIAYEFRQRGVARLVGERTAGAVIPASFQPVGDNTVLMYPSFELPKYTRLLEGAGVEPDVSVAEAGPYSAGHDPLIEAGVAEAVRLTKATAPDQRPVREDAAVADAHADASSDLSLPTATELIERMIEAVGGAEAVKRQTAHTLKGTVEIVGLARGELTVQRATPRRYASRVSLDGVGEFRQGYDGQTGWRMDPHIGARLLDGAELAHLRHQADIHDLLHMNENYRSIEVVGRSRFAKQDCIEARLTDESGTITTIFVDPESWLTVGSERMRQTPAGEVRVTDVVETYETFDGVKLATRTRHHVGGFQEQVVTINSVSSDAHSDDDFEPPPAVRELTQQ